MALAAHQAQLHGALQQAYDDLRQTQQTVMQQERLRALGQMASGIAHDINNAISPVALYTESLLEREPNLSDAGRAASRRSSSAPSTTSPHTVARMREFYRQREPQLTLAPVDLNRARAAGDRADARALERHAAAARHRRSSCTRDLAPGLPRIMGAESEIRDALTNLIFNAVDAMPEGGTLTLRTVAQPGRGRAAAACSVEVADTGVGMDEETRRRCLEPFFTTKGERGTGLGLAMVYGMVQRHSAEFEIDSDAGQGHARCASSSRPTRSRSMRRCRGARAAHAPMRRLRMLLIDDDPMIIKSLRRYARRATAT